MGGTDAPTAKRPPTAEGNLGLVPKMAKAYLWTGVGMEELYQQGVVGLLEAERSFDPREPRCFQKHAINHIRRSIQQAARDHWQPIRPPAWVWALAGKYHREADRLAVGGVRADFDAVCDALPSMTEGKRRALRAWLLTRNEWLGFEGPLAWLRHPLDDNPPDRGAGDNEELDRLRAAVSRLTEDEGRVIALTFGLDGGGGSPGWGVALAMRTTPSRIRNLREKAVGKLRAELGGGC